MMNKRKGKIVMEGRLVLAYLYDLQAMEKVDLESFEGFFNNCVHNL